MSSEDEELIDLVAQAIWWNAGANDPKFLRELAAGKWLMADGSTKAPMPSWGTLLNKDMWRRMAVAGLGAAGIRTFQDPELKKRYEIRENVPK
jgi:hypothetical protein